ncbi:DUF3800 domain-containing protein [Rathayibacter sp. AY1A7]|uniref:DUF3800 domain-containing protein n=1 Tax=Rathayibacter sp. AY1A7 TaxID=2080524 RepID=UPI000CE90326|nr:DUF3800 domain-containing protein [Rathayibacter sp. AY1A7]PPF20584.1 hypothetical protein C5B95_07485 [Rathayibacter sp. AY1A7]
MGNVYIYADETGNLDYGTKSGASAYFGFGTAVFRSDHPEALWGGLSLRASLAAGQGGRPGVPLPKGFHAVQDSWATRTAMFQAVKMQQPRFDSTFLAKANAYDTVRSRGEMYLYKMAWFLHFKYIAQQVSNRGDTLVVVVATLGTNARQREAEAALRDVCAQVDRKFVLCVWDASTSWGLQVADYGLWAVQRHVEGRSGTWYQEYVEPSCRGTFFPWGRAS